MKDQLKTFNNKIFIATFTYKGETEVFYFRSVNEAEEYLMDLAFIHYNDILRGYLKCNDFYKIADILCEHDIFMSISINLNDVKFVKVDFENEKYSNQVAKFSVDGFASWVNTNLVGYSENEIPRTRQDAFEFASKEGAEIWIKYNE